MKKTIITLALLVLGVSAFAQNLNPTVEVTNTYVREAGGIEKPAQLMQVPDSVLRFNLDFDYSVQPTPYKGAYEFKPYLVQLRPMPRPETEGRLFVRVGAGYSLHPEATVVWTPVRKEKFRLNVYADHQSYMGYYRNIRLDNGYYRADGLREDGGADMRSVAGVSSLLNWSSGQFSADLHYRNIYTTDLSYGDFSNNSVHFQARLAGKPDAPITYEASTHISYLGQDEFREFHSKTSADVGARIHEHNVGLRLGAETVTQGENTAVLAALTPRYKLTEGRFQMDLGLKISYLFGSQAQFYTSKSDFIFPDISMQFEAIRKRLVLQASVTGGDHLNVYTDMLESNHFLGGMPGFFDNSVERMNFMFGGRGNIAERFHYNLKFGYAYWKNGLLWGIQAGSPCFGYVEDFNLFYTDLHLGYESDYLEVDGHLLLRITDIENRVKDTDQVNLFAPAMLSGKLKALYNWGGRIKAGITLEAQTDRVSAGVGVLPGYIDLGLYGSLQMTRTLAFWLRGGNLLNQTIQRVPLYAERGIYFTAGITWNL